MTNQPLTLNAQLDKILSRAWEEQMFQNLSHNMDSLNPQLNPLQSRYRKKVHQRYRQKYRGPVKKQILNEDKIALQRNKKLQDGVYPIQYFNMRNNNGKVQHICQYSGSDTRFAFLNNCNRNAFQKGDYDKIFEDKLQQQISLGKIKKSHRHAQPVIKKKIKTEPSLTSSGQKNIPLFKRIAAQNKLMISKDKQSSSRINTINYPLTAIKKSYNRIKSPRSPQKFKMKKDFSIQTGWLLDKNQFAVSHIYSFQQQQALDHYCKLQSISRCSKQTIRITKQTWQKLFLQRFPSTMSLKLLNFLEFPNYCTFKFMMGILKQLNAMSKEDACFMIFWILDSNSDGLITQDDLIGLLPFTEQNPYLTQDLIKCIGVFERFKVIQDQGKLYQPSLTYHKYLSLKHIDKTTQRQTNHLKVEIKNKLKKYSLFQFQYFYGKEREKIKKKKLSVQNVKGRWKINVQRFSRIFSQKPRLHQFIFYCLSKNNEFHKEIQLRYIRQNNYKQEIERSRESIQKSKISITKMRNQFGAIPALKFNIKKITSQILKY